MGSFSTFPFVPFTFEFGIFFLQLGGIEDNDFGDISGGVSTVDIAAETFPYQFGEQAGMVQMSMGKQNGINGVWRYWERFPVPVTAFSFFAEAAIHQYSGTVSFEKIAGTGNTPGGT